MDFFLFRHSRWLINQKNILGVSCVKINFCIFAHTMTILRKIAYILVALLTAIISHAAIIGNKTMVNLTQRDGLAGETVYRVMTDHNGYKWIATTGGVNIFNGRHLMTMRIENEKGQSLEVRELCETDDHSVYAATTEGLYCLTLANHQFEHVLPEIERPLALMAVGDTLYIGSEQGIHIYDGKQLKHIDIGVSRQGLDNIVRHFQRDSQGTVWFLGRHDLYTYDPRTGSITNKNLPTLIGNKATLTQFCMLGDRFFIGTRNNGLYSVSLSQQEAHTVDGIGKIVLTVSLSDSLVCIGTDGSGAYVLEVRGKGQEKGGEVVKDHFSMNATNSMRRLPTNAVYSFSRDSDGTCWIGMVRCGLAYKPHNGHLFHPYQPFGITQDVMADSAGTVVGMNVRSFLICGSQSVIGLQDGLWLFDSNRQVRRFFSSEELGGHIVNNIVWWQGRYYIGMYDGGVRVLDPLTVSLSSLTPNLSPLKSTTVGDMKVSPVDSSLWVGCTDGLFVIKPDGTFRQFTEQNSHITGGIIISITFDSLGNAWLTGAKGLSLYSKSTGDMVETKFPDDFFHHEAFMRGLLGHDGTVYMRTGPQLFFTNSQMSRYGEISLPIRLTDKWCRSMADASSRLWLASERGLLGIDSEGRNIIQLGEGEGLWGDQISEVSITGDTLWVATSAGLFFTTQHELDQWTVRQGRQVTLYNVRKGSDLISPEEMTLLSNQHKIRLTWNFTSQPLQVEPLLLDYARQDGRLYEYKIDDGQWQIVEDGQVIDVRCLLLGSHQLTVRQAGVKGTETIYQLTVIPSVVAWIELALFIVAIILLWLWWRFRKYTKVVIGEHQMTEEALIEEMKSLTPERGSGGEAKYQKVRVDEDECADIVSRMKEYIERERVFTNPDLKMKDLADVLHLSAPKLSQVFNLYLNENYYEFINRYRLDEFKRLIEAGEYKRFTITALSEQCGFKKSNFFSTFRKVEGMTPAEYLKKRGISV